MRIRRLAAWITLAAVLFTAVSPAAAAFVLRDRPYDLRQMLGLVAPGDAGPTELCRPAAGTTDARAPAPADPAGTGHEAHATCILCIPGALAPPADPAPRAAAAAPAGAVALLSAPAPRAVEPRTSRHPRDPPGVY